MDIKFSQKKQFQKERQDRQQVFFQILKSIRKLGLASMYQIGKDGATLNSHDLTQYLEYLTQVKAIEFDVRIKGAERVKCYYLTEKGVTLINLFENLFALMPSVWLVL